MDAEQAAALRVKFPDELVGKLPRVWCKACRDNKTNRHCADHQLVRCEVCKQRITSAHLHLDYVGHATVTDRLLKVDPEWSWAPVAHDQNGLPQLDQHGGLWITLKVAGVSRLGYGDAGDKKGPNAVKEAIGDALRNAAMRFGVGLDLWAKEDLQAAEPAPTSPRLGKGGSGTPPASQQPENSAGSDHPDGDEHQRAHETKSTLDVRDPDNSVITQAQRRRMFKIATEVGVSKDGVRQIVDAVTGTPSTEKMTKFHYDQVVNEIRLVGAGGNP